MAVRIGIVGLGEAGSAVAGGLAEAGGDVLGWDVRADAVGQRSRRAGVRLAGSLAELVGESAAVVNLTSAKVALAAAGDAAAHLGPGQVYADWNSASPQLKREVGDVVAATGALFADGAVMSAVPPMRHRVPVLLSGAGADPFVRLVDGLGMDLEVLGPEPGQASAVKLFRSLLVKGLEALIVECLAGAEVYGATERVLGSMAGSLPFDDWTELARYLVERSLEHGERRAEELRQAAATLAEAGVEPLLASAGAQRLQWLVDLRAGGRLDPGARYEDLLATFSKGATRDGSGDGA